MLCLPIQKPKTHDTWKWFYTLESGNAQNILVSLRKEAKSHTICSSHPRPDYGDHGVRELLTSTSCLTSPPLPRLWPQPLSPDQDQAHRAHRGQHWDQLGVRRLMPFPTTFLLSPVVKCASKSKVNDNSQSLSVSWNTKYIFQIKIK